MTISTDNLVSMYVILDFALLKDEEIVPTDEALTSARKFIHKHLSAFEELAK